MTGATGFVGKALVRRLVAAARYEVRAAVRREVTSMGDGIEIVETGDLSSSTDWSWALSGVDVVVALAARVHMMDDTAPGRLGEYRRVNVDGTLNLGRQAARGGVRRLIFLSSVKVNGEAGTFDEADPSAPSGAYGISKSEAEVGLREIAALTRMEVVIIRPPLVYGPEVRANFRTLIRVVALGIPLPLGAIKNRRSLVALDNLVDLIWTCLEHPSAANETFLVSDGEDLSTTDLVRRLARAMGRPARLIPVPARLLMGGAVLLGRRDVAQRLLGSLQVDISKARQVLGWTPPVSVDEGLRRTVALL